MRMSFTRSVGMSRGLSTGVVAATDLHRSPSPRPNRFDMLLTTITSSVRFRTMSHADTSPSSPENAVSAPPPPAPAPAAPTASTVPPTPGAPAVPTAPTVPPAPKRYAGRIGGLDIARALAILGMYYAHTAPPVESSNNLIEVIAAIPHGRSSILFALLAGVSLAILTGRNAPYSGERMRTARLRIFGRACALLLVTGILSLLGTAIALILSFYAAWFVCSLPFSRWSAKRLFIAAGVVALVGPPLCTVLNWLFQSLNLYGYDSNYFAVEVFITGIYPGLTYMAFILAGMGIGRLDITRRRLHGILIGVGCILMGVGYGGSWILTNALVDESSMPWYSGVPEGKSMILDGDLDDFDLSDVNFEDFDLGDLDAKSWSFDNSDFSLLDSSYQPLHWQSIPFPSAGDFVVAQPHSATTFETLGSGGFALVVLGICLLLGGLARTVLFPLAAVGSMSLTAYSGHVIALGIKPEWGYMTSWTPLLILCIGALLLCSLWKLFFQRGPLEWFTWKISVLAARTPGVDDADILAGSASTPLLRHAEDQHASPSANTQ